MRHRAARAATPRHSCRGLSAPPGRPGEAPIWFELHDPVVRDVNAEARVVQGHRDDRVDVIDDCGVLNGPRHAGRVHLDVAAHPVRQGITARCSEVSVRRIGQHLEQRGVELAVRRVSHLGCWVVRKPIGSRSGYWARSACRRCPPAPGGLAPNYPGLWAVNLMLVILPCTASRSARAGLGVNSGPGQQAISSSSPAVRGCLLTTEMSSKPAWRTVSR